MVVVMFRLRVRAGVKARFTRVKQAQATGSYGEICEASASARQWEFFHSSRLLYTCEPGFMAE